MMNEGDGSRNHVPFPWEILIYQESIEISETKWNRLPHGYFTSGNQKTQNIMDVSVEKAEKSMK